MKNMETKGKTFTLLVINPGSTSTKLALYHNEEKVFEENIDVPAEQIRCCKTIYDQYDMRLRSILDFLQRQKVSLEYIDCFVSRGCGSGNQKAGAYIIDKAYLNLCRTNGIPHISNIGPILAHELAAQNEKPALVYDAEGVNERDPLTLLSGLKELKMNSGSHVLNTKMVARKASAAIGRPYEDCCIVVCHMGGGVSTSCHKNGRLIDSCYDAYAPERTGGIPASAALNFVNMCFSGEYTKDQLKKMLVGKGGLISYLGISDLREVERMILNGDREAAFYYDGMVLSLAKDIASVSATVNMQVDAIALTGGMANSKKLTDAITERIGRIAPVLCFPGSYEIENLVTGALRVLRGEEHPHHYGTDQ